MSIESYNIYKQNMVENDDKPLSLEDEIGIFNLIDHNQTLMRQRAEAESDEDLANTGHDFQDYNTSNWVTETEYWRTALEKDVNKNWNRGKALRDIYNRHIKNNDELGFFEKKRRKSEMRELYRKGSTKYGDARNIEFSDNLSDLGKTIRRKADKHSIRTALPEDYNIQSGIDVARFVTNVVADTAETAEFIYDAPKHAGTVLGWMPGWIGDFGDAWYEGWDFAVDNSLGLLIEPLQSIGESEFAQYKGYLKQNPHLANSLEFAAEVLITLPVEFALVGKSIKKLGDAAHLRKMDKVLQAERYLVDNRIKRWYYGQRKKSHENILSHGGKMDKDYNIVNQARWDVATHNSIKEINRDIAYVNTALIGTEASFQGLESASGGWFDNDNILVQGVKLPAMLFSGIFAPHTIHKTLQRAGIVEGGGRSIIKDIKFHAGYAAGQHEGKIDDYLEHVMGYDKATINKLGDSNTKAGREAKFAVAKITREDYYSMRNMGQAIRDMEVDFGKQYADDVLDYLSTTLERVDDVIEIRAFADGYATGRGGKQLTVKDKAKWIEENGKAYEATERFFDQLIGSQTVRALRNTLTNNVKIPILQRLNAETLYQDSIRHTKIEAKQREELAITLDALVKDSRAMGNKDITKWLEHSKSYNLKAQNEISDSMRKLGIKREEAINTMAKTRVGKERLSRPNLRNTLGPDISDETLRGINQGYDLMRKLGYTPTKTAIKNIETAGIKLEDISEEGVSAASIINLKNRRKTWDDAYKRIRDPLDKNYEDAKKALTDVKVDPENAEFDSIFKSLKEKEFQISDEAAYSGLTPAAKQATTFRGFHDRTIQRHIDDLQASGSTDDLRTLAINDADDIHVAANSVVVARTQGGATIGINEASTDQLANYLKGRLKGKYAPDGEVLRAKGIDAEKGAFLTLNLNELHMIKSNYRDIALMNMDNATGFAASNMATDLSNLIKVAGESLGDDVIMTFAKADEAWAENFVPLFKRGAGARNAAVGKKYQTEGYSNRPHMIDDNAIFKSFIQDENPEMAMKQFRKIFGSDERATRYLKQDLGELIETGEFDKLPVGTIKAMKNHGIIDQTLANEISAWKQGLDVSNYEIAAKNTNKYFQDTVKLDLLDKIGPEASPVNMLINQIAKAKLNTKELFKIIDSSDDVIVDQMVKTVPKEKRAAFKESIVNISSVGLADEVIHASAKGEVFLRKGNITDSTGMVRTPREKLQADTMTKRNMRGWKEKVKADPDEAGSWVRNAVAKISAKTGVGEVGDFLRGTRSSGKSVDELTDPIRSAGRGSEREYGIDLDSFDLEEYGRNLVESGEKVIGAQHRGDNYLAWSEAIDSVVLQERLNKSTAGKLIKKYQPKRYKDLIAISDLTNVTDFTTLQAAELAQGAVRSLSVESMISRMYSIVRGVVSARYVMTEAGFQAYRTQKRKILAEIIKGRQTPNVILDMLAKDGLRDPVKKARWFRTLRGWFAALDEVSDEELEAAHKR